MATTTTTDVAGIVPAVVSANTFDAIVANITLSALAEENRELEGGPGDRVVIGTFGDLGEAVDLAENDVITPKNVTATGTPFIVGRIGDGAAYTRDANIKSGGVIERKAGAQLGLSLARRIDRKLGINAVSGALGANKLGDGATGLTRALMTAALAKFEDVGVEPVLVCSGTQLNALATDLGAWNAAQYGANDVIREGVYATTRLMGVRIVRSSRLVSAGTGRRTAMLFLPGRTLVSAYSQRPTVDVESRGARNAVEVYVNGIWAGGVQEPATLVTIDALG